MLFWDQRFDLNFSAILQIFGGKNWRFSLEQEQAFALWLRKA
jgi:hypothetical protein